MELFGIAGNVIIFLTAYISIKIVETKHVFNAVKPIISERKTKAILV